MTPHLTLVAQAPLHVEPLFPLFQAGVPWALMGIAAAALVRPVADEVVRPLAEAMSGAAAAVGEGARRITAPVRAFDARLERIRAAMRRDDEPLTPMSDDGQ